jgi:hypothetical protein
MDVATERTGTKMGLDTRLFYLIHCSSRFSTVRGFAFAEEVPGRGYCPVIKHIAEDVRYLTSGPYETGVEYERHKDVLERVLK